MFSTVVDVVEMGKENWIRGLGGIKGLFQWVKRDRVHERASRKPMFA